MTVIGKAGRNSKNIQLWKLQCNCGKIIEKPRINFDNNKGHPPSCGCQKRLRVIERNQKRAKPDCTGMRFGRIVVLGKGGTRPDSYGSYIQFWRLQCDCGNIIERTRESFDRKGQVSCGCARKLGLIDNKRRPRDISGQRFGSLTAIKLTGYNDDNNRPAWMLACDCGNTCELSLSKITHKQRQCLWVNCGDSTKHPERYLEYPPTPNPYPKEAGELLEKYLHLSEIGYQQIDSAIEDEKRDRLIRACWILTYRRSLGEQLSELYEKRYIKKSLRYCSIDVFWRRKLEQNGGFLYTVNNKKKEIGIAMADGTSLDYPELELEGITLLPINNSPSPKRLKFRRC
ncbi:hypothetical protein [Aulosira sp. FACHB-615]|uniref:hypothetical protein n=1 Tax=Aulosira sp. FACHB-615 TaxID=2692777 RepID=UPI001688F951|nr:hypothetical protein [Aulosira sp. FACHB-615]MBD2492494.1 hypothetical protein [Aulosira sp. FACHB-615]